jgi:hypothetical protein
MRQSPIWYHHYVIARDKRHAHVTLSMEVAVTGNERDGYSSNEICDATGLRRTTLDAWVLRRYLNLSEGPGTGRERRFSFDEVVMIAIAAELTRLGLSVGIAAHAANYIDRLAADGKHVPIDKKRCLLIVRQPPRTKPIEIEAPSLMGLAVVWPATSERLAKILDRELSDSAAVVVVDISATVRRAMARIGTAQPKRKGRPKKAT